MTVCDQNQQSKTTAAIQTTGSRGITFKLANIKKQVIYQQAFQSVIWGIPAINYALMLQEIYTKATGNQNAIVYYSIKYENMMT